jgi:hypothetical protein
VRVDQAEVILIVAKPQDKVLRILMANGDQALFRSAQQVTKPFAARLDCPSMQAKVLGGTHQAGG